MKCDECKWWDVVEEDESERESLQKDADELREKFKNNLNFEDGDVRAAVCEFQDIMDVLQAGDCRRFPPTISLDKDDGYDWYASFPKTQYFSYCGEFVQN